jgi:serine phosphatase RsbU (regulator of sigma subunit)
MQWQLLPARAFKTRRFYIAGHLEPALRVAGDTYDFVVDDHTLTAAVIDASRTDGAPSWPTTLAITALRNARRSGLPLYEQASLASDVVWAQRGGRDHVSATLLHLDAHIGRASIVHAGSPDLLRMRDGQVYAHTFDPQTPLGMFEGTRYSEQRVDLQPGDRIYLLTDGAVAHDHTLPDLLALLSTADYGPEQSPPETVRRLIGTLLGGRDEPDDDITVVCLDWLR